MSTPLSGLSDEQRAAAIHTSSPVMALAGAGSGKTRMLTGRFFHLVQSPDVGGLGADPSSIMMVTFTNKAAREMRERIVSAMDEERERDPEFPRGEPWIGTFHGLSLRILRIEAERAGLGKGFSIFDESDARSLLSEVVSDMGFAQFDYDEFFRDLEAAKARVLSPQFLRKGLEASRSDGPTSARWKKIMAHFASERFVDVYERYQGALDDQNAVDFNDLLNKTTKLFQEHPEVRDSWRSSFRHFMVDEVQDINRAQVAWLHAITGGGAETPLPEEGAPGASEYGDARDGTHVVNTYRLRRFPRPTIAFVGDDDQSIYGFRGSEVAVMRGLGDRFPGLELRMLKTSYRCAPQILSAANALIEGNSGRFGKNLEPRAGSAELAPVRVRKRADPDVEIADMAKEASAYLAAGGPANEFAVLVRTRSHAKQVAKEFRARGLPVVEGKSTDLRKTLEVKDAMSFANALCNPDAEVPLRRIANKPSRGLGLASLKRVSNNAKIKEVSFLQELRSVMAGKIDLPAEAEPYTKRFVSAAREFKAVLDAAGAAVRAAPDAGAALESILRKTGYLDSLYEDALKAAGITGGGIKKLSPKDFIIEMVRRNDSKGDASEMDHEDLADRAGALSDAARRVGNISLLLAEAAEHETLEGFVQEGALEMSETAAPAGVQVMTIHASKGLEFDHVRLPFWIEGVMPHGRAEEADDPAEGIEEERRLAYVAITRARKSVQITAPLNVRKCGWILRKDAKQSRFIDEIAGAGRAVQFLKATGSAEPLFEIAEKAFEKAQAELPKVATTEAGSPADAYPDFEPAGPDRECAPLTEDDMQGFEPVYDIDLEDTGIPF